MEKVTLAFVIVRPKLIEFCLLKLKIHIQNRIVNILYLIYVSSYIHHTSFTLDLWNSTHGSISN